MKDQLRQFISERFSAGKCDITNETSLFSSGLIDSLKLIELIAFVEKTFKISVNMDDVSVDNFNSIDNICKLIGSKRS